MKLLSLLPFVTRNFTRSKRSRNHDAQHIPQSILVEIRNSACFLNYLVLRTIDAAERVHERRKRVKNFRTLAGRRPGSFRRRGDNERKGVEKEDWLADGGYTRPKERNKSDGGRREMGRKGGAEKDGRRKTSRGRELEKYNLLDREGARVAQARTGRTIQWTTARKRRKERRWSETEFVRSRREGKGREGEKGIREKRTERDGVRRGIREGEGRRRPEPASTPTWLSRFDSDRIDLTSAPASKPATGIYCCSLRRTRATCTVPSCLHRPFIMCCIAFDRRESWSFFNRDHLSFLLPFFFHFFLFFLFCFVFLAGLLWIEMMEKRNLHELGERWEKRCFIRL